MNYDINKVLMCDRCRKLFVATKHQLKNYLENEFYFCIECEKQREIDRIGQESFMKGRQL